MRKLFYMGLEPYKARYTLQLQEWNQEVFHRRGINYVIVPGETLSNDQSIVTGQVLDAHGRTYFGMSQIMNLVKMMKAGEVNSDDVIYFEDMFAEVNQDEDNIPRELVYIQEEIHEAAIDKGEEFMLNLSEFENRIVHLYNQYGNMRKVEKATGISYSALRAVKNKLKEQR